MRQLILRDLEEEGWSLDSDDTPTNEANSERSPLSGTVLRIAEEGEPEEDVRRQDKEPPSFQIVRKGRKQPFSNEGTDSEIFSKRNHGMSLTLFLGLLSSACPFFSNLLTFLLLTFGTLFILCIAVVAGPSSSSVPDNISDDVTLNSQQSSKARGERAAQGNDNQTGHDILWFTSG